MIVPNSFEKVLNHSILVSKETRRIPCTRGEQEASVFLHKNVMSGYTLFHILNPPPNAFFLALSKGAVVFDFPTAYVIARAMFEACVNMHFLLIDPVSDEEREFRLDRWDKHALTERQKMGTALGSTSQRLAEEADQIKALDSRILNAQYFAKLPANEQQSIRNSPKWYRARWHLAQGRALMAPVLGLLDSDSRFILELIVTMYHHVIAKIESTGCDPMTNRHHLTQREHAEIVHQVAARTGFTPDLVPAEHYDEGVLLGAVRAFNRAFRLR